MSIYDIQINYLNGNPNLNEALRNKVVLFVNVASKCGLTPQYQDLQKLYLEYSDKDFAIVGVPCNQFGNQEPGTPYEIQQFCSINYSVTFPLMEKIEVNGSNRHALYSQLVNQKDLDDYTGDIRWNFEKFIVNKNGSVVARFSPDTSVTSSLFINALHSALV